MGDFKVHRVNMFDWSPQGINSLAFDKATQRLAVSRVDGSVEIWSQPDNWYQEKVIALTEKRSVEGMVWMKSRLFSVGMDSKIVEYDLVSLSIKREVICSSNGIWCITQNEEDQQLAVGTEDGCVMLFNAADDNLEYLRSFDKLEGRIMCIGWHTGEALIVTGGFHSLRIWSVKSGHALQRIVLGREDTLVWCLAVTSDLTISCGDSRGKVSFFNGKQGTRITQFQSHQKDVLTLCVDETETNVFSAGVDAKLVKFSYVPPSDDSGWQAWVRSSVRTYHTHDVRASVVAGNTVITGGVDTGLSFSQISGNRRLLRKPSIPSVPLVSVAKEAELVMLNYPTSLDIWRLGHTDAPATVSYEAVLPLQRGVFRLARVEAPPESRISCSAISSNGSLLAYSDQKKIRALKLSVTDLKSSPKGQITPYRLPSRDNQHPAQRLAISPDGNWLIAATSAPSLQIWQVSGEKGTLLHTVLPEAAEEAGAQHSFTNLCVSDNSKMVATSDSGGNVHLYRLSDGQVTCRLPKLPRQATALAFTPAARTLLVTYSDHKVMEFDVLKEEYTPWSRGASFPEQWLQQRGCLRGVMCQPGSPHKLFLHSEHNLLLMDRSQPMPEYKSSLFRGQKGEDRDTPRCLTASTKYRYILHMELLDADTLVIVERTPLSIQDSLPPALHVKKFGT